MTDSYTITYKGKAVSLNQFYSGAHWSVRSNIKNKYRKIFIPLIEEQKIPKIDMMELVIEANSRHDVDNLVAMGKIFMDCVKTMDIIDDDNPKHYKSLTLRSNKELPSNTFSFNIKVLNND